MIRDTQCDNNHTRVQGAHCSCRKPIKLGDWWYTLPSTL